VLAASWLPDGELFVSATAEGSVVVQDAEESLFTNLQLEEATCLAWSRRFVAVGQSDGLTVLELANWRAPGLAGARSR
jgi:hypothetical protein